MIRLAIALGIFAYIAFGMVTARWIFERRVRKGLAYEDYGKKKGSITEDTQLAVVLALLLWWVVLPVQFLTRPVKPRKLTDVEETAAYVKSLEEECEIGDQRAQDAG